MEAPRSIELPDRYEVEKVDPGPDLGDRTPGLRAGRPEDAIARQRGPEAPDRSSQSHPGILPWRDGILFQSHDRSDTGNEHRGRRLDPEARERSDVTHLVDVDRSDKSQRKTPSPQRPIDAERQHHR